jgi:hypothetical protein
MAPNRILLKKLKFNAIRFAPTGAQDFRTEVHGFTQGNSLDPKKLFNRYTVKFKKARFHGASKLK